MNDSHVCQGMITLECQPGQQNTLNKAQTDALIACVSKELEGILKTGDGCALVLAGATYPSEQILQPGFPVHNHLHQYASAAFQGERNQAQMLAIGGDDGQMPQGLQPLANHSPLLHIPYLFITNDVACAERFEAQLMHKGMISPPTYQALMDGLHTPITHANHMTNLDLVAMMHNHYEQLGLSEVWSVIETALIGQDPKVAAQTPSHNHFFLVDHLVFTPQFAWPEYLHHHPQSTPEDYVQWLLYQRQGMAALSTHGLEVKPFTAEQWPPDRHNICLGQFERHLITGDHWTCTQALPQPAESNSFNYWTDDRVGVVGIQTIRQGEGNSQWHQPLHPQGIQTIEAWHKQSDDQINHISFCNKQSTPQ